VYSGSFDISIQVGQLPRDLEQHARVSLAAALLSAEISSESGALSKHPLKAKANHALAGRLFEAVGWEPGLFAGENLADFGEKGVVSDIAHQFVTLGHASFAIGVEKASNDALDIGVIEPLGDLELLY
jgi:hypothetical protein